MSPPNEVHGDSLYGRRAGSVYERRAAEYIRDRLAAAGLQPAVEGYLQPFSFIADIEMEDGNAMLVDGSVKADFVPDADFRPLGFSSSGSAAGELVFAGYGISAEEPDFDDYAGLPTTTRSFRPRQPARSRTVTASLESRWP